MTTKHNLKKILIIRLTSIGDVVLTTHLPRLLKNNCGEHDSIEITLLTSKSIAPLFTSNNNYTNIIQFDGNNIELLNNEIINFNFDIVLDLQKNSISKQLLSGYDGDLRIVNKYRKQKLEMVYLRKFPEITTHVADRYMDTCRDLIIDDGKGLELISDNHSSLGETNKNKKIKTIGMAPEAYHYTKRWLADRYSELIDLLLSSGFEIKIFGNNKNTLVNTNPKVENYCGKLSLLQTAQKISECDLFISNDTGLMHIASAFQIPILLIFGSSVKELGFTPYRVDYELIETEIWCRPCSHIGRSFCPLGHFKCMKQITVEDVYSRFNKFIDYLSNR